MNEKGRPAAAQIDLKTAVQKEALPPEWQQVEMGLLLNQIGLGLLVAAWLIAAMPIAGVIVWYSRSPMRPLSKWWMTNGNLLTGLVCLVTLAATVLLVIGRSACCVRIRWKGPDRDSALYATVASAISAILWFAAFATIAWSGWIRFLADWCFVVIGLAFLTGCIAELIFLFWLRAGSHSLADRSVRFRLILLVAGIVVFLTLCLIAGIGLPIAYEETVPRPLPTWSDNMHPFFRSRTEYTAGNLYLFGQLVTLATTLLFLSGTAVPVLHFSVLHGFRQSLDRRLGVPGASRSPR